VVAEIPAALLEFSVIFFRNQPISGEQQLDIAARFGVIDEPHPVFDNGARESRRQSGSRGLLC
jgi:alpha-ketoglutarate-dependent taurine dioxygenase